MSNPSLIDFLASKNSESAAQDDLVTRALETVRQHLEMDVAYVSEIVDNKSVFRKVDAPGLEELIKPGDEKSLDDVYCKHILEGRLPELMPDTSKEPFAANMPVTEMIGAHVSVPLRRDNGQVYGMFCCFSAEPKEHLNERDLNITRAFAGLVAEKIGADLKHSEDYDEKRTRIEHTIANNEMSLVFQPIVDLSTNQPIGFESLARFSGQPQRPPNEWFDEANEVGLGIDLELRAIRTALEEAASLPDGISVSVNASPFVVVDPRFGEVFDGLDLTDIVVEITEHAQVEDYGALGRALKPLRNRGLRLAIDDAGGGYAGLQYMLLLHPDIIKLDISLTSNVHTNAAKSSLASALVLFASQTGAAIIAEGIETQEELNALKMLGVHRGQGYLLGRPAALVDALEMLPADDTSAELGRTA